MWPFALSSTSPLPSHLSYLSCLDTNLPEMPFEDGAYKGHIDDNGRRNGYGIFTDAAGNSYEGEWLNDEKHGFFSVPLHSH